MPPQDPLAEAIDRRRPLRRSLASSSSAATRASPTRGCSRTACREATAISEIGDLVCRRCGEDQRPALGGHPPHRRGRRDDRHLHHRVAHRRPACPFPATTSAGRALNDVLNPLGLAITRPRRAWSTPRRAIVFVDPLTIGIVPSPDPRRRARRRSLGALQPARESLFDLLLELDCGNVDLHHRRSTSCSPPSPAPARSRYRARRRAGHHRRHHGVRGPRRLPPLPPLPPVLRPRRRRPSAYRAARPSPAHRRTRTARRRHSHGGETDASARSSAVVDASGARGGAMAIGRRGRSPAARRAPKPTVARCVRAQREIPMEA